MAVCRACGQKYFFLNCHLSKPRLCERCGRKAILEDKARALQERHELQAAGPVWFEKDLHPVQHYWSVGESDASLLTESIEKSKTAVFREWGGFDLPPSVMSYVGDHGSRSVRVRVCRFTVYDTQRGWLLGTFALTGREPTAKTIVTHEAGAITGPCRAELRVRRSGTGVVIDASEQARRENSRCELTFGTPGDLHISLELERRALKLPGE